jgi:hypothetical protein
MHLTTDQKDLSCVNDYRRPPYQAECAPPSPQRERVRDEVQLPRPTVSLAVNFVVLFLALGRSGYAAAAASGIQLQPTRSASSSGARFLRTSQMVVLGSVGHFISLTTPALLGTLAATAAQPS